MKKYKAVPPKVTIRNIKRILKENNILTKEETISVNDTLFSARITIINGKISLINLGANGKGETRNYALASGYAELMERLQTRFLYPEMTTALKKISKNFFESKKLFLIDSEEFSRRVNSRCLTALHKVYFPKCGERARVGIKEKVVFANMLSLKTGKNITVPLELLHCMTGSTGCCAGNCQTEAIVQGICEILERHMLQLVYLYDKRGLPEIAPEMFRNSSAIRKLLVFTKVNNLNFSIKDCSFGTKFPVLGLLLWNDSVYQFKIAAATNPNVALMRCLTEIYQGCIGNERLLPRIPELMVASPANYMKSKVDGSGHWPKAIFEGACDGTLKNFSPFEGHDIDTNYEILVDGLISEGFEILLHNCSFLGFPSFYIYIPGLSDVYPELFDFNSEFLRKKKLMRFNYFRSSNVSSVLDVSIDDHCPPIFNTAYRSSEYPISLFRFSIALFQKNYLSAYKWFSKFQEENKNTKNEYNKVLFNYLRLKMLGAKDYEVLSELRKSFTYNIVKDVIRDFGDDSPSMTNMSLPTCFRCNRCPTRSTCLLKDIGNFDATLCGIYRKWKMESLK